MAIEIKFTKLHPSARIPRYETACAAGVDLSSIQRIVIKAMTWRLVGTGLAIAIPEGYEGQIRPRSGIAAKHGVTVLNSPGTIDADYRGEIKVALINHNIHPFEIAIGDRIAQLVIAPVVQATFVEGILGTTDRGSGGFGSTGQ